MRVLVAEDSEVQRRQLTGLLRRAGHEVVEARDGHEALRVLLDASGPKVALLDWEMPGLDGPEVCRKAREAALAVRPHLVLLSARTDREDAVEGLKAGADDFLSKPPSPGELMARLKVGQRVVETQHELLARAHALELALGRIEAVSSLAANVRVSASGHDEPLEAVARRELEPLVQALSVTPGHGVSRAHGSLALVDAGVWLDLVLEVEGALGFTAGQSEVAMGAFAPLPASAASTELLADLVTTWLKRTAQALRGAGHSVMVAAPGRALTSAAALPGMAEAIGPVRLRAARQPLEVRAVPFAELTPGLVLVAPLTPTSRPELEVLKAGTWLTTSHLERSRAFFVGADAQSLVRVGAPTSLARSTSG
ncbi:MAG: response regulator transcription factor [Myxococcaceae bacterium]|jgi:DNA-binding response OmpR family regulator|nr:response regulator transcription factor [Myxococcaceae bacterium]